MPLYENVFIARQDISGAQVDALADGFTTLIAEQGGEVKKREYWGLRNLAYRMNKNRKGHYMLFNIDAPAPAIAELERTMRINEDVVRYLTLRVDALEEAPRRSCRAAAAARTGRAGRARSLWRGSRRRPPIAPPRRIRHRAPRRRCSSRRGPQPRRPSAPASGAGRQGGGVTEARLDRAPAAEPPAGEGEPAPSEKVEA
jgi:small subunit ribosomal protein S6